MGFQPPPPYGGFPFEQHFSSIGASLREVRTAKEVKKVMAGGILSVAMFVI